MGTADEGTQVTRQRRLVLGATVRTLGAWPSGWRQPGAHRDPYDDPAVLARTARSAEAAGLHFLFFGDWLATATEYEHSDPYLLARLEPMAAISYLAAITERIGLIATVNSSHTESYTVARSAASIDILSGGRVGLSIASGSDPRTASNFGWDRVHSDQDRVAASAEFIDILRGLWDSWEQGAFVADPESGQLIDLERIHPLGYVGSYRSATGPLNVLRPPQGNLPIAMVSSSPATRALAAREADIVFATVRTKAEAVDAYAATRADAVLEGREAASVLVITPILPIVAATREEAWSVYDRLVESVPVETAAGVSPVERLPANRTLRSLAGILGVPLTGVLIDEVVPTRLAARFSGLGLQLVETVRERSGRTIGGLRGVTFRHLLVAHVVAAPIIVGSARDIADHLEDWFTARAVDGFTVLTAYLDEQFDAFTSLVVPELRGRGLLGDGYTGATLREHLGLAPTPNSNARVGAV